MRTIHVCVLSVVDSCDSQYSVEVIIIRPQRMRVVQMQTIVIDDPSICQSISWLHMCRTV